mgnify:FL=1
MAYFKMFEYGVLSLTFKLTIFSQQIGLLFNILFSGVPGNFRNLKNFQNFPGIFLENYKNFLYRYTESIKLSTFKTLWSSSQMIKNTNF